MSTFMKFTDLYSNKPVLINLGAVVALRVVAVSENEPIPHTEVFLTDDIVLYVKEPISAFFQQPPQTDPPDSGKAEVSTEGVPI